MNALDGLSSMNLNVICHCHCGDSETPAVWKLPSGPTVSAGMQVKAPPACELVDSESIFPEVVGDARAPPVPQGEAPEVNPRIDGPQLASSSFGDAISKVVAHNEDADEKPKGARTYSGDVALPLMGSPMRVGEVWQLGPDANTPIEKITLSLHMNGFSIKQHGGVEGRYCIAWSPFGLVQACRLHSAKADQAAPEMQLFKITVFQLGSTFFFAVSGENAHEERARWVSDISRSIRILTVSLIPPYELSTEPLPDMACTDMRLLAGYMLLCESQDVMLIYCELRSHWNFGASINVYEDEQCRTRIMHIDLSVPTLISERVGIDCSCFSLDGFHLTVRSTEEKHLWLRAINNVKVKLKHRAENPTPSQLADYRAAIWEYASRIRVPEAHMMPLLPLRAQRLPDMLHVNPSRQLAVVGPDGQDSEDDRLADFADEPAPPEDIVEHFENNASRDMPESDKHIDDSDPISSQLNDRMDDDTIRLVPKVTEFVRSKIKL